MYDVWENSMQALEQTYQFMVTRKVKPEEARAILPNSLKTELVMTANIREWRHFFKLRTSPAAHPQMREIAGMMLEGFKGRMPVLFGDIGGQENGK
jgi:thymidylate synthase (FAD)